MKPNPIKKEKPIKQQGLSSSVNQNPLPAGITFITERSTSDEELKKSVQILTRTLSSEMRKFVTNALEDQGES